MRNFFVLLLGFLLLLGSCDLTPGGGDTTLKLDLTEVTEAGSPRNANNPFKAYILGSIHAGREGLALPDSVVEKLVQSDYLVMESDSSDSAGVTRALLNEIFDNRLDQDSDTTKNQLSDYISADAMAYLGKSMDYVDASYKAPSAYGTNWAGLRLYEPVATETLLGLSHTAIADSGLEAKYGVEALVGAKASGSVTRLYLESAEQVFKEMFEVDVAEQAKSLESYTSETKLSQQKEELLKLYEAYLSNDRSKFDALAKETERHTPSYYKNLFVDRNTAWKDKIIGDYLEQGGTYFIVVGRLHLHGDDSLLEGLRGSKATDGSDLFSLKTSTH